MKCEGDHNGCYVTNINSGDYVKVRGVDFGEDGATHFTAKVRAEKACVMMVRLDTKNGAMKASLQVQPTNGEWQEFTCELKSPITGLHDLFFTFKANDESKLDIDCWQFSNEAAGMDAVQTDDRQQDNAVYSISGAKADKTSLRKGVYIEKGRKKLMR